MSPERFPYHRGHSSSRADSARGSSHQRFSRKRSRSPEPRSRAGGDFGRPAYKRQCPDIVADFLDLSVEDIGRACPICPRF